MSAARSSATQGVGVRALRMVFAHKDSQRLRKSSKRKTKPKIEQKTLSRHLQSADLALRNIKYGRSCVNIY
jgi:hypothetical protein